MNILIVKLSAVGDVVHTLPSLAALRKLYSQAHITWVIEAAAADLIKEHPHLDRVLISQRKRWLKEIKKTPVKTVREVLGFIKALRDRRYDLAIDFHGLLKSSLIVWLAAAQRKLGYDSMQELSGLFLTEKIPEDMAKHAVDRYLDLVRYLGGQGAIIRPGGGDAPVPLALEAPEGAAFMIPSGAAEEKRVAQLLEAHHLTPGRFVVVNPVALWDTKLWEEEGFARLGERLVREYGLPVVFTGTGKKEIGRIQALMLTPSVSLAGETTLRELACLYRQAALLVSTDTGPMHIAAAVGTPVVALFGPTDPCRTGPYGRGHRVVRREMPCSPCFRRQCPTRECLRGLKVGEVWQAVEALLNANGYEPDD